MMKHLTTDTVSSVMGILPCYGGKKHKGFLHDFFVISRFFKKYYPPRPDFVRLPNCNGKNVTIVTVFAICGFVILTP
jgi:hypothetical protein